MRSPLFTRRRPPATASRRRRRSRAGGRPTSCAVKYWRVAKSWLPRADRLIEAEKARAHAQVERLRADEAGAARSAPSRTSSGGMTKRPGAQHLPLAFTVVRPSDLPFTMSSYSTSRRGSPLFVKYSFSARTAIAVSRVLDHSSFAPVLHEPVHRRLDQRVLRIDPRERAQRERGRLHRGVRPAPQDRRCPSARSSSPRRRAGDALLSMRATSVVSSIRTPLARFSTSVLARSCGRTLAQASAKSARP